ncbi:PaaI family thioesterase [Archangium sp.]|uniref:PaaI family thioesterase n=1 Tax=Archangium sp. TaxID=1872627 RepID=UPI002D506239|nr:PaaI family thioesterase [Archangium sp.]HYO59348.1 PaaI family thioesterase [Archangium sp.]
MSVNETIRELKLQWVDPMQGARAALSMSGLEYMRAMLRGEVAHPPIAVLMGIQLVEVEEGRVVAIATPGEQHYNPIGLVHGGFISTLLDSTTGCAVHTTLPQGMGYGTVDLHVTFVRPLSHKTGQVRCEGKVLHQGKRMTTAEGRLVGPDGKMYAHATATCMLTPTTS